MIKQKELDFAKKLLELTKYKPYVAGCAVDIIVQANGDKQLYFYLDKWSRRGWWEYGVSSRTGWFTPEGIEHFKNEK